MQEIWKDIKGYEGRYQISNLGNVKSLSRKTEFSDGKPPRYEKEKLLTPAKHHKGYVKAQLRKNNNTKAFFIHRLVAQAFIPNPEGKATVNHKDGNKVNNTVVNLEWLSNQENMKHAYATGIRDNSKVNEMRKRPVAQYSKDGQLVRTYESVKEAVELNPTFRQGGISSCALGNYKTSHGFVWKYI